MYWTSPRVCVSIGHGCVYKNALSLSLSLFLSVSLSDSLWLSQQPLAQPPDCGPFSDSPLGGIAYQPLCKPLLSPHAPTLGAGDWGFALYDPSHKSNPPGLAPIRNSSTAPGPPPAITHTAWGFESAVAGCQSLADSHWQSSSSTVTNLLRTILQLTFQKKIMYWSASPEAPQDIHTQETC